MREATKRWIQYYISSENQELKIQAVDFLAELNTELFDAVSDIADEVSSFAKESLTQLTYKDKRNTNEERMLLQLLRIYAIKFDKDMDISLQYWNQISAHLKENNTEVLKDFYFSLTHPRIYTDVRTNDTDERILLNKILLSIS